MIHNEGRTEMTNDRLKHLRELAVDGYLHGYATELMDEVEALRAGLGFYADKRNYTTDGRWGSLSAFDLDCDCSGRGGKRARAILNK